MAVSGVMQHHVCLQRLTLHSLTVTRGKLQQMQLSGTMAD